MNPKTEYNMTFCCKNYSNNLGKYSITIFEIHIEYYILDDNIY